MRISIIIPTLNEAANIAAAIERARQFDAHEVIVVDGGSEDETFEIAADRGCLALRSPRGRGTQLNHGARHASGEVLLFLHADNWLGPPALMQIKRALKDPNVAAGAFRQRIEADGFLYRLLERGNAFRAKRLGRPWGDQGIFIRRELFERIGGFPEAPIMEDVGLMRRVRRHTRPVLLPGPIHVSARRWQRYGIVRQTLRNWSLLTAAKLGVSSQRLARWYPAK